MNPDSVINSAAAVDGLLTLTPGKNRPHSRRSTFIKMPENRVTVRSCRGALRAPANHPRRVTAKRAHAMRPYKYLSSIKSSIKNETLH
jgi:hypothetical protein